MNLLPLNQNESRTQPKRAEWLSWSHYSAWCCFKGMIHVISVGFLLFLQELSFRLYYFKVEKDKRGSHSINPCTATLILVV